jgi:hypothetical protein
MIQTKLDFSAYIARRTKNFIGREWVFQAINDWLSVKDTSRYFLLTGEPGCGKSAIAARLTQFSLGTATASQTMPFINPGFLSAVHFCLTSEIWWINPHTFAQSLALQLADRYPGFAKALAEKSGDRQIVMQVEQNVEQVKGGQVIGVYIRKLDVSALPPQDAFIRVVREPLETLISQGFDEPIVILVDSLDESLHYSGTDSIASLLSSIEYLPANIHFILTSRLEKDIIRPFGRNSFECSLTSSKGLSRSKVDVEKYVSLTLTQHPEVSEKLVQEMSQKEFITAISEKSEGNFLYLSFLLDMLKSAPERITQDSLDHLPIGLDGTYIGFIERLTKKDMEVWTDEYAPVLGTLAVARSSLTESQISAFVKMNRPEVRILLQKLRQLLDTDESVPASQRVYTTYHRSFADFLLNEDRAEEYWCDEIIQHERIARYYLNTFRTSWNDCDTYGLSQLVSHIQFLIKHKQKKSEQDGYIKELCSVVTDESFRHAQIDRTSDPLITLNCLQTALDIIIEKNDVVAMLGCAGAFRDTYQSASLTKIIFDSVAAGDFAYALQKAKVFRGNEWTDILNLYVIWEAAESGDVDAANSAMESLRNKNMFQLGSMGDALIVRTVRILSHIGGGYPDAKTLLESLSMAGDTSKLLEKYAVARKLEQPVIQKILSNIEQSLLYLDQTVTEGTVEGVSLDSERAGSFSENLQEQLSFIAADPSGQSSIDRALKSVLGNPYPQYRDIALMAVGAAIICAPDRLWVRDRLQRILITTIEREGVAFTFDLPSILVSEARRRNLKAPELEAYLDKALCTSDRWGTAARATSAHAAALFFEGDVDAAFEELEKADQMNVGMAGFSTLTLLSFADRCYEFGQPGKALSSIWGFDKSVSLLDGAIGVAQRVRDPKFRSERLKLVEDYRQIFNADIKTSYFKVFESIFKNHDKDMTLLAHISSKCCYLHDEYKWKLLKMILQLVPSSSTTLDIVLARIFRFSVKELKDDEVEDAIRICSKYLTSGRPWEFGEWGNRSFV